MRYWPNYSRITERLYWIFVFQEVYRKQIRKTLFPKPFAGFGQISISWKIWNRYSIKKWLYKAVNNICHERLREKIKIADDDIGEYREIIADKRNDIDIVIEDHEFDRLVEQFEAELTGPEKKAFRVLIDKDSGASYVELSAEYDLPISTLTSLTSRLRKKAVRILDKILKR